MIAQSVQSEEPENYCTNKLPAVLFAHGKESGPRGDKIQNS